MPGYYSVKKTADGQFMFNLHAGNHGVILTSEFYVAKSSALDGIESVRRNGQMDAHFERTESKIGQPYFVVRAANQEPIGSSEMYSSAAAMEKGIRSVMENAASMTIKDLS